ncbi:MAG TPA: MarR family transcriptional regulator [Firmicutes bacterium]|nr:MarR family transcriptional regulator [Bacillota bacterium]
MENYKVILEYFEKAPEPVRAGKVAEDTGIDRKEVDKVMNKLKKEEKIISPKHCFWALKD